MIASDYSINFPYGATSAPYSAAHPHRGDDRPCPAGTEVVIDGTVIGLTGATGMVSGPHLHIQEWQNDYSNTRKPQNAFAPGTVVNIDPAGTQGDGSFGKFITIQTADGWNDTYCHLSQINVSVGQVIEGEQFMKADKDFVAWVFDSTCGRAPRADELKQFIGWDAAELFKSLYFSQEAIDYRTRIGQEADKVDSLTQANLKLTDQITALKATPVVQPTQPDPNSVTVTQSGLWAALLKFLGKG